MTDSRLWPSTNGPSNYAANASFVFGCEFYVTERCVVKALHLWRGSLSMTGTFTGRVYRVDSSTTGTAVTGTDVTFTLGSTTGWKTATLTTPVELVANQRYRVAYQIATSGNSSTAAYWRAGGAGASGITNGPLVAPNAANTTGNAQNSYVGSASMAFPTTAFDDTNYWVDVTVAPIVQATAAYTASATLTANTTVLHQATAAYAATAVLVASLTPYLAALDLRPRLELPASSGQVRRASARWRVLIADTRTGQILGELPYEALTWSDTLDFTRTSSLSVTAPLETAEDVARLRSLARGTWRYTLLAVYDGRAIVGGPLLTHKVDPEVTSVELGCGGPASIFGSRLITRVNLVTDPSFEAGITGWDVIGPTGSTTARIALGVPPTDVTPPDGSSWLRVTSGGTTGTLALVSPRIPITAGLPYTVSLYLRNSIAAQTAEGFILWYDEATGLPWEWDTFTYQPVGDVFGGWVRKSITATAPSNAVALAVQVQAPATSVGHYLDADAVLVEHSSGLLPFEVTSGEIKVGPLSLAELARRMVLLATLKAGTGPGAELPISLPTVNPNGTHVRTYEMNEVATIAERLGQLTQVEGGPDVHLRPVLADDGRSFTWDVRIGEPRLGSPAGWTWTYGANCSAIGVDYDATAMTMRAFVPGQASEDATPVGEAEDLSLIGSGWPLLERADSARSTTETTVNLDAQAADFLRAHDRPVEEWQVTARADTQPALGTWLLGDEAVLRVRGHRWIEDGDYPRRILAVSGTATDEITLGVTSGEGQV